MHEAPSQRTAMELLNLRSCAGESPVHAGPQCSRKSPSHVGHLCPLDGGLEQNPTARAPEGYRNAPPMQNALLADKRTQGINAHGLLSAGVS